ncbi:hypothetical protein FKM82_026887 [Ascaphus truei]
MAQRNLQGFAVMLLMWFPTSLALPKGEVTVPELLPGPSGQITLRFSTLARDIELQLLPDDAFLAPGMQIEHVGRAGGAEKGMAGLQHCFYSSREPLAAVSLCKGVQGAFLLGQDRYVIQPMDTRGDQDRLGQHLVFKSGTGDTQGWGSKSREYKQDRSPHEWRKQDIGTYQHKHSAETYGQNRGNMVWSKQNLVKKEKHRNNHNISSIVWKRHRSSTQKGHMSSQEGSDDDRNSQSSEKNTHSWTIHEESTKERDTAIVYPARHRRFVSEDRFVETLLVADASMVQFYGEDLKLHLLTLMSVAARIYKHPSLRNSVSLVVVKVLVVEDEEAGPEVSDNGGLTLRNFCNWQQSFNPPSDRNSEHYDTAILLTRQDFCGHESCDTLGVADIGTVCNPSKSCSVIEDDGLQAAYTLAHELGHVLSIPHDNSKNCEKLFGELGGHHLMAPLFLQLNKSVPWSPCSAMHLTDFFDTGHGKGIS